MKFENLSLYNWKQFDNILIDFHPNLTIITGANGSGKSTIINILARLIGYTTYELSTPELNTITGSIIYQAPILPSNRKPDSVTQIGEMGFPTHSKVPILAGSTNNAQYSVVFETYLQGYRGLYIPSHRDLFSYQKINSISTQKRTKNNAFDLARNITQGRISKESPNRQSTNFSIKETLLGWAIAGSGNEFIVADTELYNNFKHFEDILLLLLPPNIGFEKFVIINYEVMLKTKAGSFMLDAASGGIGAIIDLAWQIFTNYDKDDNSVIVLIDEVENHLHPNLQRSILPNLINAFPDIQFIVTTHSPLIVGSVKDSNVYALRFNTEGRIYQEKLDLENKAKSASDVLNEVLGVPFTMPIWVEDKLNQIVEKYTSQEFTEQTFTQMRQELKELGLENWMPEVMTKSFK